MPREPREPEPSDDDWLEQELTPEEREACEAEESDCETFVGASMWSDYLGKVDPLTHALREQFKRMYPEPPKPLGYVSLRNIRKV